MGLALLFSSGCAATPSTEGPLDTGVKELGALVIGMCPAGEGFSRAIGIAELVNTDPMMAVVIDSVRLLEADGVALREGFVVLLNEGEGGYGGGFEVPPSVEEHSAAAAGLWERRVPVAGATLPPLSRANLLLGVVDEPRGAHTVMGAEISYHRGESRYLAVSGIGAEFVPADDPACRG
ncbi:MAG: hypothetical protein FWD59_02590 [Micrococcales bacterium]|nr:hypothetical protein [Micrococcales bacterium]